MPGAARPRLKSAVVPRRWIVSSVDRSSRDPARRLRARFPDFAARASPPGRRTMVEPPSLERRGPSPRSLQGLPWLSLSAADSGLREKRHAGSGNLRCTYDEVFHASQRRCRPFGSQPGRCVLTHRLGQAPLLSGRERPRDVPDRRVAMSRLSRGGGAAAGSTARPAPDHSGQAEASAALTALRAASRR